MALSYVNILDLQAAWAAANDHARPAVAIVKHTNPCGLAVRDSLRAAYAHAHAGDPLSAYGGIVGFNREVDLETVAAMKGHFYHVVVAPGYAADALRRLRRRKNLRIMRWSEPPARRRCGSNPPRCGVLTAVIWSRIPTGVLGKTWRCARHQSCRQRMRIWRSCASGCGSFAT